MARRKNGWRRENGRRWLNNAVNRTRQRGTESGLRREKSDVDCGNVGGVGRELLDRRFFSTWVAEMGFSEPMSRSALRMVDA
jgi:hypothetical protein